MLSRAEVDDALQTAAGRKDPLPTSAVASTEPGSRYIDFLIPGLLGMNLMNSGMWGIGFALVDMRQRKLLKRFVGTPMRRSDFLLALTTSRLVLMLVEIVLLLGFGVLAFHMRVLGSLFTILLLNTVGAVSFAGLGLLTASRAQKIESVSGLMNLVMMPMWIFSGVFFSSERFPAMLQPVIKLLPLTALNDALRATILQGASLGAQSGRIWCCWLGEGSRLCWPCAGFAGLSAIEWRTGVRPSCWPDSMLRSKLVKHLHSHHFRAHPEPSHVSIESGSPIKFRTRASAAFRLERGSSQQAQGSGLHFSRASPTLNREMCDSSFSVVWPVVLSATSHRV